MTVDDSVNHYFEGALVKSFDISSTVIIWITPEKGKI